MYNVKVRFDGDIIITDPCYIVKKQDKSTAPKWEDYMGTTDYTNKSQAELQELGFFDKHKSYDEARKEWNASHPDDWEVCCYGDNMEALGLKTYLADSTIYGDWSCTTFNKDTKNPIGEFCADSGQVGVFLLEEVLAYNPNFDYHITKPWTTTLIKDFHGEIELHMEDIDEDGYSDTVVTVEGSGNINFIGTQTGL